MAGKGRSFGAVTGLVVRALTSTSPARRSAGRAGALPSPLEVGEERAGHVERGRVGGGAQDAAVEIRWFWEGRGMGTAPEDGGPGGRVAGRGRSFGAVPGLVSRALPSPGRLGAGLAERCHCGAGSEKRAFHRQKRRKPSASGQKTSEIEGKRAVVQKNGRPNSFKISGVASSGKKWTKVVDNANVMT